MNHHNVSRREFFRWAGLAAGTTLLTACAGQAATPTVTAIPPTEPPATPVPPTEAPPEPARDRPIDTLVDTYLAAWSEPDGDKRLPLLEQVMDENGTYMDANGTSVTDRASHNEQISEGHVANPGSTVRVTGPTYHFPGHVHFSWILTFGNGSELPGGASGELSPDAKLSKIIFFF